jgi:hypothetical protein
MPPKSAKGEKKGGGSSNSKADADLKAKDAVLGMFSQLEQDKVNALTRRVDEAVMERLELQRQLDKGNRDTHEFVNYFQVWDRRAYNRGFAVGRLPCGKEEARVG